MDLFTDRGRSESDAPPAHPITSSADFFDDALVETPAHGDLIIFIARGVGVIVAVAAVIVSALVLIFVRALLALLVLQWGVLGTFSIFCVIGWLAMTYTKIPIKRYFNFFFRACH